MAGAAGERLLRGAGARLRGHGQPGAAGTTRDAPARHHPIAADSRLRAPEGAGMAAAPHADGRPAAGPPHWHVPCPYPGGGPLLPGPHSSALLRGLGAHVTALTPPGDALRQCVACAAARGRWSAPPARSVFGPLLPCAAPGVPPPETVPAAGAAAGGHSTRTGAGAGTAAGFGQRARLSGGPGLCALWVPWGADVQPVPSNAHRGDQVLPLAARRARGPIQPARGGAAAPRDAPAGASGPALSGGGAPRLAGDAGEAPSPATGVPAGSTRPVHAAASSHRQVVSNRS